MKAFLTRHLHFCFPVFELSIEPENMGASPASQLPTVMDTHQAPHRTARAPCCGSYHMQGTAGRRATLLGISAAGGWTPCTTRSIEHRVNIKKYRPSLDSHCGPHSITLLHGFYVSSERHNKLLSWPWKCVLVKMGKGKHEGALIETLSYRD